MTITTQTGLIAGFRPQIPFYKATSTNKAAGTPHAQGLIVGNYPAAFTPGSPGLSGATVDGTTSTLGGTFPFVNGGGAETVLAKAVFGVGAGAVGIGFFDLLWYNTGITVTTTTAQTVSSVTLPSRDANGATSGAGVYAWLYCSVATTNASAITNTTISYTNSAGTAGQTGTLNFAGGWPATATAGTFLPFSLAAGDVGIQSIQSITLGTSYVTGTINLMLIRDITFLAFFAASSVMTFDWAMTGLPTLYNGTAMSYFAIPTGTSVGAVSGTITYAQG